MDTRSVATSGRTSGTFGQLDLVRPSAARMYDYYLGGSTNVAIDREAANDMIRAAPDTIRMAAANRSFLCRVVGYLVEQGIDQFLDLGSGIPSVGSVHETAWHTNPRTRVAYVDNEPVVVNSARRLLAGQDGVTVTHADIRQPEAVLAAPGVADLLDFSRPLAILAVAVLHTMADSDAPTALVARYRAACVPGSYLAMSHVYPLTYAPHQVRLTEDIYARTPTPLVYRDRPAIGALLDGYELVEPGLVLVSQWRPAEPVSEADAVRANCYGAVGHLPE